MSLDLTPELITRMDRPGPRYTSYPTAPVFSPTFGEVAYADALKAAGERDAPLKLYVHLPFCERLCTYCACNVVVRKHIGIAADPYVARVMREADLVLAHLGRGKKVARLHLGGGTPNYLLRPQMLQLLAGLRERFAFTDDAELSLEVDPRHVEDGQLAWLKSLGFNRVSFGIQDFDQDVQQAIGRRQTLEETLRAISDARAAGFPSVNVDLVYGLPGQDRERFGRTLDRILEIRPDRLAIFSFAYVPEVKPHQKKLPADRMPGPRDKAAFLVDAMSRLVDAGYVQVGMDHFALPDDALARSYADGSLQRSFQGYEPGPAMDTLGLGLTSIGDIGGAYVQNHHRLKEYEAAVDAGILPVERGWTRTFEDEVRRTAIWDLMCRFRLDYRAFADRFEVDHDAYFGEAHAALEGLADEGLVELSDGGVEVTELGRVFVRNVAMIYDAYLPGQRARFSRTV